MPPEVKLVIMQQQLDSLQVALAVKRAEADVATNVRQPQVEPRSSRCLWKETSSLAVGAGTTMTNNMSDAQRRYSV